MLPLTKRQREILDYLNEFITSHAAPRTSHLSGQYFLMTPHTTP